MRFALSIFALCGLLATVTASPIIGARQIEARQESDALTYLTDLLTTVKAYTGAINATLGTITVLSSDSDKAAAVTAVGIELTSLAAAISGATTSIQGLTPVSKRSIDDTSYAEIKPRQAAALALLTAALSAVLLEVFATISGAIALLGLTALLSFVNPLTGSLGGLILAVEVLVNFLLLDVTVLLDTLLTGLALALGGLVL